MQLHRKVKGAQLLAFKQHGVNDRRFDNINDGRCTSVKEFSVWSTNIHLYVT